MKTSKDEQTKAEELSDGDNPPDSCNDACDQAIEMKVHQQL